MTLRSTITALCLMLQPYSAYAQAPSPRFDAASFQLSTPNSRNSQHRDPGRIDLQRIGLQGLLWEAYRVWYYQIVWPQGGRRTESYDITATIPAGASKEDIRQMLQALLAERLHLTLHWETRELPVYALTVAKSGLRMHKADIDPDTDAMSLPATAQNNGQDKRVQGKMPINSLLLFVAGDLDHPLVDMTRLKDAYEIDLKYSAMPTPPQLAASPMSAEELSALRVGVAASFTSALEKQLGLHVEARKAPIEMLVIDHVASVPTEN
jgi:uncharacterized protein (TIGR03435 family)